MNDITELTPMPAFALRLIRTVERLREAGIEPSCVAIPTMPETNPSDQPSGTIYGIPVLWLPSSGYEAGHVFVGIPGID